MCFCLCINKGKGSVVSLPQPVWRGLLTASSISAGFEPLPRYEQFVYYLLSQRRPLSKFCSLYFFWFSFLLCCSAPMRERQNDKHLPNRNLNCSQLRFSSTLILVLWLQPKSTAFFWSSFGVFLYLDPLMMRQYLSQAPANTLFGFLASGILPTGIKGLKCLCFPIVSSYFGVYLQRRVNVFFNYQSPTFWYQNTVWPGCLLLPAVRLHRTAILMKVKYGAWLKANKCSSKKMIDGYLC